MSILKTICLKHNLKQRIATNHKRLYRAVFAWGGDPDLASDISQEAMTKALKRLKQLREPEKLDSWLFGILVNCWRDHFRQQKDIVDIDEMELINEETPETILNQQDMVESVRSSVACLPEGQRQVVTLVNLESFSYADVADILDIPVGTVMSRLSRARQTLADYLLTYKMETAINTDKPALRRIK